MPHFGSIPHVDIGCYYCHYYYWISLQLITTIHCHYIYDIMPEYNVFLLLKNATIIRRLQKKKNLLYSDHDIFAS